MQHAADLAILFNTLIRERAMWDKVLRGENKAMRLAEIDKALAALGRIGATFKELPDPQQPSLFEET